jgi:hypothetical protein
MGLEWANERARAESRKNGKAKRKALTIEFYEIRVVLGVKTS